MRVLAAFGIHGAAGPGRRCAFPATATATSSVGIQGLDGAIAPSNPAAALSTESTLDYAHGMRSCCRSVAVVWMKTKNGI